MFRTPFTAIWGGLLVLGLLPSSLPAQFNDPCFTSGTVGTSFASSANIFNTDSDLLSWNGASWTGGWGGANITLNPSAPSGTRAIWSGDGTVWTTGGEGFGLRLSAPLVSGITYTFAFRRVSHGTGQNGNFQPTMYSNNGGSFGTTIGPIPGVGTSWTTSNISFTATGANNGHTWLYFHNSNGSGMFLGCTVVLPMAFKDLQAYQEGQRVNLDWNVKDEPDYVWHVVERSVDGLDYQEAGRVASVKALEAGHDYHFVDHEALSLPGNMRYYRIRSINQEGLEAVSPVKSLQLGTQQTFHAQVYPQPALAGSTVATTFYASQGGAADYVVYDLSGRAMAQGKWEIVTGKNEVELGLGGLAAGTYLLDVRTGNSQARTRFTVAR